MDGQGDEQKVRPVSFEIEPSTSSANGAEEPGTPRDAHRRPWLPLAVSASAVGALIAAVFVLGGVQDADEPEPAPRSFAAAVDPDSIEPLPPTLEELVPGITTRLTIIATDGGPLTTFVWDPTFRVPKVIEAAHVEGVTWASASFDSADRFLSAEGFVQADLKVNELTDSNTTVAFDVWIGPPSVMKSVPHLTSTLSSTWHSSEVDQLAYLTAGSAGLDLWTVTIAPPAGRPEAPVLLTTVGQDSEVLVWDKEGFVLRVGDTTVALSVDGTQRWVAQGAPIVATIQRIAQVREEEGELLWYMLDRATGTELPTDRLGLTDNTRPSDISASRSRDLLAVSTQRATGTTVTITGTDLNAPRILHLGGRWTPLQFTSDTTLLVFTGSESNDLLFVDWRSGAQHEFPIPHGYVVLALATG